MNKICTTVKQSKKLIELGIDVNTADMRYMYRHWEIDENTVGAQSDASIGFDSDLYYGADNGKTYHYIPAWSLASLLSVLPEINGIPLKIEKVKAEDGYDGYYYHIEYEGIVLIPYSKNLVDACVEMIEKLHKLNLMGL